MINGAVKLAMSFDTPNFSLASLIIKGNALHEELLENVTISAK